MTARDPAAVVEASERVILGAALLDPDVAEALVRDLPPAMYSRPEHVTIAQAIRDAWECRGAVDPTLVESELDAQGRLAVVGGASYLASLMDAAQSATVRDRELRLDAHAAVVREAHALRRLGDEARVIARAVEDGDKAAARTALDRAVVEATLSGASTATIPTVPIPAIAITRSGRWRSRVPEHRDHPFR